MALDGVAADQRGGRSPASSGCACAGAPRHCRSRARWKREAALLHVGDPVLAAAAARALPDLDLHRCRSLRASAAAGRTSAARPASVNWRQVAQDFISSTPFDGGGAVRPPAPPCRPGSGRRSGRRTPNSPARLKVHTISPLRPGVTCAPCGSSSCCISGNLRHQRGVLVQRLPGAEHELGAAWRHAVADHEAHD